MSTFLELLYTLLLRQSQEKQFFEQVFGLFEVLKFQSIHLCTSCIFLADGTQLQLKAYRFV